MANPVGWFEIYVQDVDRAKRFYESVFKVTLQKLNSPSGEMELWSFPGDMTGYGAPGALVKMAGCPSGGNSCLVYFSCKDCAVEAGRAQGAGGPRLQEIIDLARRAGVPVRFEPRSSLDRLASSPAHQGVIALGAARWNPGTTLFGLAGSPMLDVWRAMGMAVAGEAFADRRYEPDGTLRSRQLPDALITDPRAAAAQALYFARQGLAQTICVHGDTPGSVEILKACREALT